MVQRGFKTLSESKGEPPKMFSAMAELLIKYTASQDDDLEGKHPFGLCGEAQVLSFKSPQYHNCVV